MQKEKKPNCNNTFFLFASLVNEATTLPSSLKFFKTLKTVGQKNPKINRLW